MSIEKNWILQIDGMTCDHCATSIDEALAGVSGVRDSETSYTRGDSRVVTTLEVDASILESAIAAKGYRVTGSRLAGTGQDLEGSTAEAVEAGHLVVIGGGSAGFAAAIRAHELGARVTMVNAGTIGGTCVNVGCVPSKTLIRAAEARHRAGHHGFAGIEGESRVTDFAAIMAQKDELVSSLRQAKYVDVIASYERVELIDGSARIVSATQVEVEGRSIRADRILVATGSSPWTPPIPGLEGSGHLTSTSAFELTELPESMIVLGGRYIALELAQMFARLGPRVTVLQRSDHLLPTEDDDLTEALAGYLREDGLDIQVGVTTREVSHDGDGFGVHAEIDGVPQVFRADQLVAATGRRANSVGFGLGALGVALNKDGSIRVDDQLQSSVPGIYAAGDVAGDPAFVYTAAYEGRLAAENALGPDPRPRDYTALPWVIFTDPQVAGVGLNEKEAAQAGLEVDVAVLPLSYVPRALAARDTRGFIKLLRERGTDRLVGARILAPEGAEQIMEAALAIRHAIGVSDLAAAFHPYLTQAEGIKLCAQTFGKDVSKLSCCAA